MGVESFRVEGCLSALGEDGVFYPFIILSPTFSHEYHALGAILRRTRHVRTVPVSYPPPSKVMSPSLRRENCRTSSVVL